MITKTLLCGSDEKTGTLLRKVLMKLRRRYDLFLIILRLQYRYEGLQRRYYFEVAFEEADEDRINKLIDVAYKLVNEGNAEKFLSGAYKVKLSI